MEAAVCTVQLATDRLVASGIDRGPRAKERASDHTPVWCELTD